MAMKRNVRFGFLLRVKERPESEHEKEEEVLHGFVESEMATANRWRELHLT